MKLNQIIDNILTFIEVARNKPEVSKEDLEDCYAISQLLTRIFNRHVGDVNDNNN